MKTATVSAYKLLLVAVAATALFGVIAFVPSPAAALSVNTQTAQILPPGANTCSPIQVSNFTPFIYDGALNSFEFTVSDPAYVAVVGSVGNTSIPLRYMTRHAGVSGGVRYHIDIDSTSIAGSLPVTITLLSAATGAPVCASVVTVDVGNGISTVTSAGSTGSTKPTTSPTPSKPLKAPSAPSAPSAPAKPSIPASATPSATSSSVTGSSTTGTSVAPVSATIGNPLKDLCVSDASAFRLWLILLVIYALIVGGLLWLEFPMSWAWLKTPERVASAVLILLVLLLAFWYLSTACRAALWMPLLAFLIAALGLLAAFWNHPRVTQLLLIEQKPVVKQPAIITPPPSKK